MVARHDGDGKGSDGKGEKKDLLGSDPQLSAAVLLLRLELADAKPKT